jgi:hypothetical protein
MGVIEPLTAGDASVVDHVGRSIVQSIAIRGAALSVALAGAKNRGETLRGRSDAVFELSEMK